MQATESFLVVYITLRTVTMNDEEFSGKQYQTTTKPKRWISQTKNDNKGRATDSDDNDED